jgi:hypothetical protein
MATTDQLRLSQASLEKHSRPASAGSSNDITHTNGMEDYPYVPENAFAGTPDKQGGAAVVRAMPPPQQDDFYTTNGDAQQLGYTGSNAFGHDEYDPFGGPTSGPNPFEAKSFDVKDPPPALGAFKRPEEDPFGPSTQRKSFEAVDGTRRRRSLANQLATSTSKIEVTVTNPHEASRPNSASTEDRQTADKSAEALFLPNIKREQYIPVRVARDKIKHVLAEMAQMKTMHLAAIETMEKQHGILKAQLENACAAYCRKLTSDYNHRLTALEGEYKKRLTSAGHLPPEDQVAPLRTRIRSLEQALESCEQQLAMAQTEVMRAKATSQSPTPSQAQTSAAYEQRIRELEQALEQSRAIPEVEELEALREENMQLRQYCEQLEGTRQHSQQGEEHHFEEERRDEW